MQQTVIGMTVQNKQTTASHTGGGLFRSLPGKYFGSTAAQLLY
jgi:hypothetical protein